MIWEWKRMKIGQIVVWLFDEKYLRLFTEINNCNIPYHTIDYKYPTKKSMRRNPSKPTLLFLLTCLLLILNCQSLDFHLQKIIQIPTPASQGLANLISLSADTVAVVSGNFSFINVAILEGDNYQREIFRTGAVRLVSEPKFVGRKGVAFNTGNFLTVKYYDKYDEFTELNISGNALADQSQGTFFTQSRKCPTLRRHSTYNTPISMFTYGNESECDSYAPGFLSRYNNGRFLAYATKYSMLIIDVYYSYRLVDNFTQEEGQGNNFSGVQSFYAPEMYQVLILGRQESGRDYLMLRKTGDAPLVASPYQLYTPTSNLTLTSLTTALSFHDDYLYRWQKLDNLILSLDFSPISSMQQTLPVAISNSQTLIMQKQNNYIIMYELSQNYYVRQVMNTTFYGQLQSVRDGRFAKDQSLFVVGVVTENGYYTFCWVNFTVGTKGCLDAIRKIGDRGYERTVDLTAELREEPSEKSTYLNSEAKLSVSKDGYLTSISITQTQTNSNNTLYQCLQFLIFSQSNKLVGLCINGAGPEDFYELQLFQLSTMTFIHAEKIYVGDIPTPEAIKLVSNEYKEENEQSISDRPLFLVSFKVNSRDGADEARTFRYRVEPTSSGYEFIRENTPSSDISFHNVYAYGHFIASMKIRNATTQINELRIYDFMTMRLIKSVPYQDAGVASRYYFIGYHNILMVHQNFGLRAAHIYDLKKFPNQPAWFRGSYHYRYFESQPRTLSIIFPKRNLHYFYKSSLHTGQPYKLIYSLQKPPIQQIIKMGPPGTTAVQLQRYFKVEPLIVGRECENVFYVSGGKWLDRWWDCGEERGFERVDLNPDNRPGTFKFTILSESSSKQNLILSFTHTLSSKTHTLTQIRPIGSPSQVVYSQNKTSPSPSRSQPISFLNYIETLYGTQLTIGHHTYLRHWTLEDTSNSSYFQLFGFDDVEIKDECMAFGGRLQKGGGVDSRVYYSVNRGQGQGQSRKEIGKRALKDLEISWATLQADSIKNVILAQNCSKMAILSGKGSVLAWDITDQYVPVLIKNLTRTSDVTIQFSGNDKLVIQRKGEVQIVELGGLGSVEAEGQRVKMRMEEGSDGFSQKLAVSSDGQIYAIATEPFTVHIKTTQNTQIRTFMVPQPHPENTSILSLSFSPTNSLLITLTSSTAYILSPTPCPAPFINDNGLCICRQNETRINDTCECVRNFVPVNGTCLCDLREFVYEAGLCVCGGNSTEVEGRCKCLGGFVRKDATCLCPSSFQFSESKMTCLCNNGYVDKEECIACSFPCGTCTSSSNCETYSTVFYIVVIAGPLLLLAIIGVIVFFVLRKRRSRDDHEPLKESKD